MTAAHIGETARLVRPRQRNEVGRRRQTRFAWLGGEACGPWRERFRALGASRHARWYHDPGLQAAEQCRRSSLITHAFLTPAPWPLQPTAPRAVGVGQTVDAKGSVPAGSEAPKRASAGQLSGRGRRTPGIIKKTDGPGFEGRLAGSHSDGRAGRRVARTSANQHSNHQPGGLPERQQFSQQNVQGLRSCSTWPVEPVGLSAVEAGSGRLTRSKPRRRRLARSRNVQTNALGRRRKNTQQGHVIDSALARC